MRLPNRDPAVRVPPSRIIASNCFPPAAAPVPCRMPAPPAALSPPQIAVRRRSAPPSRCAGSPPAPNAPAIESRPPPATRPPPSQCLPPAALPLRTARGFAPVSRPGTPASPPPAGAPAFAIRTGFPALTHADSNSRIDAPSDNSSCTFDDPVRNSATGVTTARCDATYSLG